MFTHLGISAPVVLESSREVSKILLHNPEAKLYCLINLFPDYSQEQFQNFLKDRIKKFPEKTVGGLFTGILPKKVPRILLIEVGIDPSQVCSNISKKTLTKITNVMTQFQLPIHGILGWGVAQFTAGGIDVGEIDSKTMQSKLITGLYFCGEVVDIDGDSGGYNLQWAWSSGFVAGNSI
jgi:predicted Rossmann fold flavoprotein